SIPAHPPLKHAVFLPPARSSSRCQRRRRAPGAAGNQHPAAQCEPLLITWSGGILTSWIVQGVLIDFLPLCSQAVQTNPIQPTPIAGTGPIPVTETSFTWIVNATLGQSLLLLVTDDEGDGLHTVTSAPFQVIAGAGDGCINKN
ncbi:hypothetical protein K438DRAFT_2025634, partial [Mycena galopus ATCC 62051]